MKALRIVSTFTASWFALAVLMTGCVCVVHEREPATKVQKMHVTKAPPPARAETRSPQPRGEDWVWIGGHWEWDAGKSDWEWVAGAWEKQPDKGKAWVEPKYEEKDGSWIYVPGRWASKEDQNEEAGLNPGVAKINDKSMGDIKAKPVGEPAAGTKPGIDAAPVTVDPGAVTTKPGQQAEVTGDTRPGGTIDRPDVKNPDGAGKNLEKPGQPGQQAGVAGDTRPGGIIDRPDVKNPDGAGKNKKKPGKPGQQAGVVEDKKEDKAEAKEDKKEAQAEIKDAKEEAKDEKKEDKAEAKEDKKDSKDEVNACRISRSCNCNGNCEKWELPSCNDCRK